MMTHDELIVQCLMQIVNILDKIEAKLPDFNPKPEQKQVPYLKWKCKCGWIYDEETGCINQGVSQDSVADPQTRFDASYARKDEKSLPPLWICPVCDSYKTAFVLVKEVMS